ARTVDPSTSPASGGRTGSTSKSALVRRSHTLAIPDAARRDHAPVPRGGRRLSRRRDDQRRPLLVDGGPTARPPGVRGLIAQQWVPDDVLVAAGADPDDADPGAGELLD